MEEHQAIVQSYKNLLLDADARAEAAKVRVVELEAQLSRVPKPPVAAVGSDAHLRAENDQLRAAIQERDFWLTGKDKTIRELQAAASGAELLRDQLNSSMKNQSSLRDQLVELQRERSALLSQLEQGGSDQGDRIRRISSEMDELRRDHDDLLIILSEVEAENAAFRARLGVPET